jgi:hypothetical protein
MTEEAACGEAFGQHLAAASLARDEPQTMATQQRMRRQQ